MLPTLTKAERPRETRRAWAMTATPRAPLWEHIAARPGGGGAGAKVALRRTRGSVAAIPRQLGPTMRMPCSRAVATTSSWRRLPSSPLSANPAETMTRPFTPMRPHDATISWTCEAGTAMTARSTASGTSSMDG